MALIRASLMPPKKRGRARNQGIEGKIAGLKAPGDAQTWTIAVRASAAFQSGIEQVA
jgi:hypothetical protein